MRMGGTVKTIRKTLHPSPVALLLVWLLCDGRVSSAAEMQVEYNGDLTAALGIQPSDNIAAASPSHIERKTWTVPNPRPPPPRPPPRGDDEGRGKGEQKDDKSSKKSESSKITKKPSKDDKRDRPDSSKGKGGRDEGDRPDSGKEKGGRDEKKERSTSGKGKGGKSDKSSKKASKSSKKSSYGKGKNCGERFTIAACFPLISSQRLNESMLNLRCINYK
jgi:type IV secretory pathway VirB10-like protein